MYVPLEDPIRISRLTIRNISGRPRRLSVTAYVEWVLGTSRAAAAPFIVTEMDARDGRDVRAQSLERDVRRRAWPSRTSPAARPTGPATGGNSSAVTAPSRNPRRCVARSRSRRRVGAGLDPCGALQAPVQLERGRDGRDRLPARRGGGHARRRRCWGAIGRRTWTRSFAAWSSTGTGCSAPSR